MKRFLVAFLAVLVLLLGSMPAWAGDPQFDENWLLVPNQSGKQVWGPWWVDGDRVLHYDYAIIDPGEPGAHTIVGRHLTMFVDMTKQPPDVIEVRHNVCTKRTYGNTIYVNETFPASYYEVYSVDGIPYWRWVEEDPEAKEEFDAYVRRTGNHRFYEMLKCLPGQRKVELWVTPAYYKGGYLTAALHAWESVTPYYLPARPYERFGRVYVPVRGVLDRLGAEVSWDPEQQAAVISGNGKTVVLKPNSETALVDGSPVTIDAPPEIRDGRMMLPLRFVSETLGYSVNWQPADSWAKQVVIGTKS